MSPKKLYLSSPVDCFERDPADTRIFLQSLEPGEGWFYDYRTEQFGDGPELAQPHAHPANQPVPGPYGRVPRDWRAKLHQ
jgi:hypothetical protein